jgi:hypothetical protein
MHEFGPKKWLRDSEGVVATPVGVPCQRCEEPIEVGDFGLVMPHVEAAGTARMAPHHRECFLRSVFGSVGHQRKKCSCFGGTEEDPPEMTKREAAIAAVSEFSKINAVTLESEPE